MGVVVDLSRSETPIAPNFAPSAAGQAQAARLLADFEIAKARSEMDAVTSKAGDPLVVEIHAIRRALALLDLTLHTHTRSRL